MERVHPGGGFPEWLKTGLHPQVWERVLGGELGESKHCKWQLACEGLLGGGIDHHVIGNPEKLHLRGFQLVGLANTCEIW